MTSMTGPSRRPRREPVLARLVSEYPCTTVYLAASGGAVAALVYFTR